MVWKKRKTEIEMVCPAFKGFLAHAHEKKDVPMSDADDRQCYALCLRGGGGAGAFASDTDDSDGGQPTHVHIGNTCASFRTRKCSLMGD